MAYWKTIDKIFFKSLKITSLTLKINGAHNMSQFTWRHNSHVTCHMSHVTPAPINQSRAASCKLTDPAPMIPALHVATERRVKSGRAGGVASRFRLLPSRFRLLPSRFRLLASKRAGDLGSLLWRLWYLLTFLTLRNHFRHILLLYWTHG